MEKLDAHARPPEPLQLLFKTFRKLPLDVLATDPKYIDVQAKNAQSRLQPSLHAESSGLAMLISGDVRAAESRRVQVYSVAGIEGLRFIPGLLQYDVQRALLDCLLHRDLADARHQTNVNKHFQLPYIRDGPDSGHDLENANVRTSSFFAYKPDSDVLFKPLDEDIHKSISIRQFLDKKLRWMTLGGQYDWTSKVYPDGGHPDFPDDIATAIRSVFPEMKPEAAICNIYSPGDTLSLHRDVSENVDADLVSISIGCDALFFVSTGQPDCKHAESSAIIRLRSGDAVLMSGQARFAWHGVPRVIAGTCPCEMESWPAHAESVEDAGNTEVGSEDLYNAWKDWLRTKRINLNVRQIYA